VLVGAWRLATLPLRGRIVPYPLFPSPGPETTGILVPWVLRNQGIRVQLGLRNGEEQIGLVGRARHLLDNGERRNRVRSRGVGDGVAGIANQVPPALAFEGQFQTALAVDFGAHGLLGSRLRRSSREGRQTSALAHLVEESQRGGGAS
nr:hypothetical protein [Tanacetum cinerariifolium]